MATKPKKKSGSEPRRNAGGAATASGMNFQATVTAIAGCHLLLGEPLGWLEGLVSDIPTAIWAETGGPGDDVRIEMTNGEILEAQVKRGLHRGSKLWESLLALARGVETGVIHYGVLVVSPDTSNTILTQLASDIQRLGEGRTDNLSEIGEEWVSQLSTGIMPVNVVCARLRIHVVHTSNADPASVSLAKTRLASMFGSAHDVERVWHQLNSDAHAITARRGRWEQASLTRTLMAIGMQPSAAATPASVSLRVSHWAFNANQYFSLLGVKTLLAIDESWLPLKVIVADPCEQEPADSAGALARYHAGPSVPRSARDRRESFDAEWIGRFHTRAIVVGGPGMGKSTLMIRLARLYARDGLPVIKVRLRDIAARLAAGNGFEDSLLQLGLDGSGVPIQQARESTLANWVLLCDGLDECDSQQQLVATRIREFSVGNPRVRIIVTTRPIGYQTAELSDWRHYHLLGPIAEEGATNLAKLLIAASPNRSQASPDWAGVLATEQLEGSAAKEVISQSPQLLGMAASLLARGGRLGASRTELYQNLFEVIDAEPSVRKMVDDQPDSMVLARVFDIVGWELTDDPLTKISELLVRSAVHLQADLDVPPLKAKSIVNNALTYWQQVGLIERVRHRTTALMTFAHKTFAEFAAARFLSAVHEPTERARLLSACLDDFDRWAEALAFASVQIGEEISLALLARVAQGDPKALERALGLLVATPSEISNDTVQRLMLLAFAQVDANNSVVAYRFGLLLAQLASRFETVIGELASARLESNQPWTQRIAWACAVEASLFDTVEAETKLRQFLDGSSRPMSTRLLVGLMQPRDQEDGLLERMVLALVRRRLAERSADNLAILLDMIADQRFHTVGFQIKLEKLANSAGMELPRSKHFMDEGAFAALMPPDDYRQAHLKAIEVLLSSLTTRNPSVGDGAFLEPPLQLSALFEICSWDKSPASDIWWATDRVDHDPMREVLRGIIALSVVHRGQLQLEATTLLARLRTESLEGKPFFNSKTVKVDVPELDWSRAGSLGLSRTKLERAALQQPQWLAILATNLLESMEPPSPDRVTEMLSKAVGTGVFTASYIARQQGDAGLMLLLDRLNGPVVPGFEHLLDTLAQTNVMWPQIAIGISRAMHAPHARIAVAATNLTLKYVLDGSDVPKSMLDAAYDHWLANEEPYPTPTSYGIVPDSPRKALLEAMFHLEPLPGCRIFELLNDTRRDVKDLAFSWSIKRAASSAESRSKLVSLMSEKILCAVSVAELLDSEIAFDEVETLRLSELLSDTDPAYRLAALRLIKPHRMPNPLLSARLYALIKDEHAEIGREARTLWDTLETNGHVHLGS